MIGSSAASCTNFARMYWRFSAVFRRHANGEFRLLIESYCEAPQIGSDARHQPIIARDPASAASCTNFARMYWRLLMVSAGLTFGRNSSTLARIPLCCARLRALGAKDDADVS
jgi:hypothetical protein